MSRRRSRLHEDIEPADLVGLPVREYVRESTERQAQADRTGPDLQKATNLRYAEQHGLQLPAKTYFDTASGRTVVGRPALQQALDEAAEYRVLLCYNTSRSFRNPEDAAIWKRKLRDADVQLVFTEPGIISGNRRTRWQEGILEISDAERSAEQGRMIAHGLRQKFERGLHNGHVPLGYVRFQGAPGDARNGALLSVERGAVTARTIFHQYGTARYSMPSLARHLNAQRDADGSPRYTNARDEPITKALIAEVLTNVVYLGKVVWHPGTPEEEIRDGRHEAIVTQNEFDRASAVRAANHRFDGLRTMTRVYPLSGPTRCRYCRGSYRGDTGGKMRRRRLRHAEDQTCEHRGSKLYAPVHEQMGAVLDRHFRLPATWQQMVLRLLGEPQPQDDTRQERARLAKALERARDLYRWGDESQDEYEQTKREIEQRLSLLAPPEPTDLSAMRRAAGVLDDLRTFWEHPGVSDGTRKQMIDEVFATIDLDEQGIYEIRPREEYRVLAAAAASGVASGRGERI